MKCEHIKMSELIAITSAVFLNKYWIVACHVGVWDGGGTYISKARPILAAGLRFTREPYLYEPELTQLHNGNQSRYK